MGPIRNHPVYLVRNLVTILIPSIFLAIAWRNPIPALVLALVLFLFIVVLWRRTLCSFTDMEIHVVRDTLFKKDVHIQYAKISTVDVHRSIVDRIFGTAVLMFTINSSVNSNVPEATLTLKHDEALKLRDELNAKIFNKTMTVEEDRSIESEAKVSNRDIVLHAMIGNPTLSTIIGFIFLLFSVYSAWNGNIQAFVGSMILLGLNNIIPWISIILRYCNYRIYRVDDTITVESGLISTYRTSFKINKVNSICIRRPFLAKMMGRAILEAEVVGVADATGRPVLCPLKPIEDVEALFHKIAPEFDVDFSNPVPQPRSALAPMFIYNLAYSAPIVAVGLFLLLYPSLIIQSESDLRWIVDFFGYILTFFTPVYAIAHVYMAQKERSFAMGEDGFLFVHGAFDSVSEYINYDKVQMLNVSSSPISRRFGLSRCKVNMMSSLGAKRIMSGFFFTESLEKVGDETMSRIIDGRYDYRKYY